jgi:hypothetical protein
LKLEKAVEKGIELPLNAVLPQSQCRQRFRIETKMTTLKKVAFLEVRSA